MDKGGANAGRGYPSPTRGTCLREHCKLCALDQRNSQQVVDGRRVVKRMLSSVRQFQRSI